MKIQALAVRQQSTRKIAYAVVALALALTLWLVVAAPQAQAATVKLDGVRTTLTTDPGTTTALFSAGIIPLPVWPTPVVPTADAAKYTFPVTGGAVNAKTLAGSIRHSGGILLAERTNTNGWKAISLTDFTINITGSPNLTAKVNGSARVEIASLDLGSAKITKTTSKGRAYVHVANVGVTLNATAMSAINSTFGTSLPSSVKLGTADVIARVAR